MLNFITAGTKQSSIIRKDRIFGGHGIGCIGMALVVMWIAGCAPKQLGARPSANQQTSLVFGRVIFSKKLPSSIPVLVQRSAVLTFINTQTSQIVVRLKAEKYGGDFYLHLPPGNYAILNAKFFQSPFFGMEKTWVWRIYASFTVPKNTPAVYIGDLDIVFKPDGPEAKIEDHMSQVVKDMNKALPAYAGVPGKKQLMQLEPAL